MNNAYNRAVKALSVLIVPAMLAMGGLVWAATRPIEAPKVVAEPEVEVTIGPVVEVVPEPIVEVGPVVYHKKVVAVPTKPKVKVCDWYPMYKSGSERVWICS